MKSANEILFEHGINTMSLNDEFNSQLFHAMERYAEEKIRDSDELSWEQLRDLWESKTKIPSAERGIISLEQFIIGYEEGLKAKSASLKPNKLSDNNDREKIL